MNRALGETLPRLAPPGAGLPFLELQVARLLFRWTRLRTTPARAEERIGSARADILGKVRELSSEAGAHRVLIPRPRGLEDSSRFWSAWMTLDHLRIVNDACAGTIRALLAGQPPTRRASTAAVKPPPEAGPEVVARLAASCDAVIAAVAGAHSLKTRARHAHPWFGPLDAHGWFVMAGMHMHLHLAQLDAILDRLPSENIPALV